MHYSSLKSRSLLANSVDNCKLTVSHSVQFASQFPSPLGLSAVGGLFNKEVLTAMNQVRGNVSKWCHSTVSGLACDVVKFSELLLLAQFIKVQCCTVYTKVL